MPPSPPVIGRADIARSEVRTRDREVVAEAANHIAKHRARISFDDPAAVGFRVVSADWAAFGADLTDVHGARYRAALDPLDYVLAGALLDGTATIRSRRGEIALARHDGILFPFDEACHADFTDQTIVTVRMPLKTVATIAEAKTGLPADELRFTGLAPISDSLRRYWADTATFICRQLTAPEPDLPVLLADQLMRQGATAVLAAFPNSSMNAGHVRGGGESTPAVVQRAREFIEANAERPLDVADIASAAGVGTRAVQAAFRRHLDVTPMAYLRRVRLEHVRRELRAADPQRGVTVAETARRWGFGNLSRFAGDYRTTFGELPSCTLRS